MSKGLEALDLLRDSVYYALIECNRNISTETKKNYLTAYEQIKKRLEALDIIKEKSVNVLMFKAHFIVSKPEYEEYQYYLDNCEKYGFSAFYLTRQEFDLLKEVVYE